MKTILALLFVLTPAAMAPVTAQTEDMPPTVAWCQVDQRLWYAEIEKFNRDRVGPSASVTTLFQRTEEMTKCMDVDPAMATRYLSTRSVLMTEQRTRLFSFLSRHNLFQQFMHEDAAGQR
jgi:hypothetical protein